MKKTIPITLSGRAYLLEDDGYQLLDTYLKQLKLHFAQDPSVDELMADIEASMAEKFSERLNEQKNVISVEDVNQVIAVLGQVEEIESDGSFTEAAPSATPSSPVEPIAKKLYRNPDEMVVGGVCSGLAAYFGIDPLLIRIIFVALLFLNGIGLLAYVILWIVLPRAETSAQKLEMRGRAVNVAELEELVKQKAQTIGQEGKEAMERLHQDHGSFLRKVLNLPVLLVGSVWRGIKTIVRTIGPIISVLISIPILIGSVLAMIGTLITTSALMLHTYPIEKLTDIPLQDLVHTPWYYLGVGGIALMCLVPLIVSTIVGISFLTRRNRSSLFAGGILLSIWILATTAAGVAAIRIAPTIQQRAEQTAQAQLTTKQWEPQAFQQIKLTGRERFTITQGTHFSIELTGSSEAINRIVATSSNGILSVYDSSSLQTSCLFCIRRPVTGIITLPTLTAVTLSNNARASVEGFSDDLMVEVRDAGSLTLTLSGQHVTSTVSDAGRLTLHGPSKNLTIAAKDAARIYGEQLAAQAIQISEKDVTYVNLEGNASTLQAELSDGARLDASGLNVDNVTAITHDVSRAQVQATQTLSATSTDVSRVRYQDTGAATTIKEMDNGSIQTVE